MDRQLPDGDYSGFSRNGSVAMTKQETQVLLKIGFLPYAVGKQPSIPLINLGKNRR